MPPPEPDFLELISTLTRAMVTLQAERDGGFSELSTRRLAYIQAISRLGAPTLTALADEMNLSKASASVAVEHLVEQGYVLKTPSSSDRRSFTLHLTEKGQQVAQAQMTLRQQFAQELTRSLSSEEQQQLLHLLSKLYRSS